MRRLTISVVTAVAFLLCVASASAAAPTISQTTFSDVTTDSVVLEADVNPQGKATKYHFEYGAADCELGACTGTPEVQLSGASPTTPVKAQLEGLTPGTTYHFRAVAKNSEGTTEGPDTVLATYFPPQVFDPCPNDELRKGRPSEALPDCRAYEQASPVDKSGQDARGRVNVVKASANGDAVSFMTTIGIPGGEGAQDFPVHLSSRAGEWSTQGILPPASLGAEAFVLGWTTDFSQVFSSARKFGPLNTAMLLSRSSAGGALTTLVPFSAGAFAPAFAGASADGSVVVFEAKGQILPNAAAGKINVYAWDKASGQLSLLSVLNDGSAPPSGAFAGAFEWIGVGGESPLNLNQGGATALHYTQDTHAITADGSAYFTSGGEGRLYLRKNPTEPQSPLNGEGKCTNPALACTIHVSDSHRTVPDPLGARPAAFQAASKDGSKVFFTSGEELTNDANTGPEADAPAIARADVDGDPGSVELEFLPTKASGIDIEGEFIYWASPAEGTIGRAKLNGDEVEEDFITGAGIPRYVAVNATHVYWTSAGDEQDEEGTIGRATIEGEEVKEDFITGANNPRGIALNGLHVFWANSGDPQGNSPEEAATRTIGRAELSATEAKDVKQDCIQVDEIAVGGQFKPQGIAINATHIYAAINGDDAQSYLFRYDLDCNAVSRLTFSDSQHLGLAGLSGIALDSSFVYWARQGQNTIGRVNLNLENVSAEREFIKDAGGPQGLTIDDEHIYWAANQKVPPNPGNDLYRYDSNTGELTDLTPLLSEENGADVLGVLGTSDDGSRVYFAANEVLAPGAAPGDCQASVAPQGGLGASGTCSLYLAEEGAIEFIARLDLDAAGAVNKDATNWLPHGAVNTGQLEKTARVSPDGSVLLFRSREKLTSYDNEGAAVLYRYDADEDEIACVSCNPTGAAPGLRADRINLSFLLPNGSPASVLSRTLSADGNRVFFESTDPLVVGDTNGEAGCPREGSEFFKFPICQDVYMWEAKGTGSCEQDVQGGGCLYLLSSGKSSEASFFADASTTGDDAFLITRSQLVGQDRDELYDVYDARLEGGLASQNQPPRDPCEGEACKPGATPAPGSQSAGSASFTGPGNPKAKKPKPRCPKGKRQVRRRGKVRCVCKRQVRRRGKVRCVSKRNQKRARQNRADAKGRAQR